MQQTQIVPSRQADLKSVMVSFTQKPDIAQLKSAESSGMLVISNPMQATSMTPETCSPLPTLGLIYFDLTYVDEAVSMENTSLTLHYRLNIPPAAAYRIYALVLNEEEVILDTIGNDIVII